VEAKDGAGEADSSVGHVMAADGLRISPPESSERGAGGGRGGGEPAGASAEAAEPKESATVEARGPLYVMLPLNVVSEERGSCASPKVLAVALQALESAGVEVQRSNDPKSRAQGYLNLLHGSTQ